MVRSNNKYQYLHIISLDLDIYTRVYILKLVLAEFGGGNHTVLEDKFLYI